MHCSRTVSTSARDAALFAEMLSLANDGRYPRLELTPEQRRHETLEALITQMEVLTRQTQVLMIFEDLHWSDPTTLEMLSHIIGRVHCLRVLLVVSFRPEFDPPWIGHPHVTALTINRLAEPEISTVLDRMVGNSSPWARPYPLGMGTVIPSSELYATARWPCAKN
jgi:predicted ATPase